MKLLTTFQSAFIGLANTAPTYGIAVAGGALLAVAGVFSPIAILLCLLIILGIFYAGSRLNALAPSYGSMYTWGRQFLHPFMGFIAGWFSLVALCMFLVYASVYSITLFFGSLFPILELSKGITVFLAAILVGVMVFISTRGISVTARFQNFFTCVELGLLAIFALFFAHTLFGHGFAGAGSAEPLSLATISQSFLLGIFFFWGWEVVFNLSEDSANKFVTPRKSGLLTLIMLAVIYGAYMWMFSILIPTATIGNLATLFDVLNDDTFPHVLYVLAIIGITISIVGAIDIAIVEGAKELIAQSRDGLSFRAFSKLNPSTGAPRYALFFVGGVSVVGVVLSSYLPTAEVILTAGVTISTLLIACYYFLMPTAWLAHVWRNQSEIRNSFLDLFVPIVSLALFAFAIVETFLNFDLFTKGTFAAIVVLGCAAYLSFSKFYK